MNKKARHEVPWSGLRLRFDFLMLSEQIKEGNVLDKSSVREACRGCTAVILGHGLRGGRWGRISDFFASSRLLCKDPRHPASVYYEACKNVADVIREPGSSLKHVVLVSHTSSGRSPWQLRSVIAHTIGGMAAKYRALGERQIRASGATYTIFRPTLLSDEGRAAPRDRHLLLGCMETFNEVYAKIPTGMRFFASRDDVADLCILALTNTNCHNSTVAVASLPPLYHFTTIPPAIEPLYPEGEDPEPAPIEELVRRHVRPEGPIVLAQLQKIKPHTLAAIIYGIAIAVLFKEAASWGLWILGWALHDCKHIYHTLYSFVISTQVQDTVSRFAKYFATVVSSKGPLHNPEKSIG
eukprot:GHVT01078806.1.p1 GENE.GHVT01078806.1~~GHVT01078806.1.p1  ORF type:complete len:353 (-),score=44.12 GHVT01078806.1:43-1101(-)